MRAGTGRLDSGVVVGEPCWAIDTPATAITPAPATPAAAVAMRRRGRGRVPFMAMPPRSRTSVGTKIHPPPRTKSPTEPRPELRAGRIGSGSRSSRPVTLASSLNTGWAPKAS